MVRMPDVQPSRFRIRDFVIDIIQGAFALAGAILAGLNSYGNPDKRLLLVGASLIAFFAFALTVYKSVRSHRKEARFEPLEEPKDIAAWAASTYRILDDRHGIDEHGSRLAVYRVVFDRRVREPLELQQVIEYVGSAGGPAGRYVSARSGVIGVCARSGQPVCARRNADPLEQFRAEMVRYWGFTEAEARQLSVDRWAFFAVPIRGADDGPAVAVVFLDAKLPELFDSEDVQDCVLEQCVHLAELIRKCYAS